VADREGLLKYLLKANIFRFRALTASRLRDQIASQLVEPSFRVRAPLTQYKQKRAFSPLLFMADREGLLKYLLKANIFRFRALTASRLRDQIASQLVERSFRVRAHLTQYKQKRAFSPLSFMADREGAKPLCFYWVF